MFSRNTADSGFTLIEVLITIGIVAIIAVIVIFVVNPIELLRRSRDSNRLTDLANINKAIGIYSVDGASFGSENVVYISVPDASSTCSNIDLPALEAPWSYGCSTEENYKKADGSGWIPINFSLLGTRAPLSHLPVDPVNSASDDLYYTYVVGSWKLTGRLEAAKNIEKMENDGGLDEGRFENGSDVSIGPTPAQNPVVTGISPTSSANDASASISSIDGSNFLSSSTVKLTKTGESDISCSGFTFTSSTQLTNGTCPITGAVTGAWNVRVTNPGNKSGTFTGGFTVTSGGGGDSSPPTPNPLTWASSPNDTGTSTINMSSTVGSDATPPIEYLFTNVSCASDGGTGGTSSAWATSTSYIDSGLQANQCYAYNVQARDSATSTPNTGTASASSSIYTAAAIPGAPTLSGATTSTLNFANDANGNPSANPLTQFAVFVSSTSPNDANWQGMWVSSTGTASVSEIWISDSSLDALVVKNLAASTTYTFKVEARNVDGDETALGSAASGTTSGVVEDVALDTSSSGTNAEGGECAGSSAWDHTEICVNVPSGTPTGSASTTVKSDTYDSNVSGFTVP